MKQLCSASALKNVGQEERIYSRMGAESLVAHCYGPMSLQDDQAAMIGLRLLYCCTTIKQNRFLLLLQITRAEKVLLDAFEQINPQDISSQDAFTVVVALAISCVMHGMHPVPGGFATQPVSILQVDTDTAAARDQTCYRSLDMRSLLKQPEIQMYFCVSQNAPTASGRLGVIWQLLI